MEKPTATKAQMSASASTDYNAKERVPIGFSDMPVELHMMILEELIADYAATNSEKPGTAPKKALSKVAPCSLISNIWREIVQKKLYETVTLDATDLDDFIALVLRTNVRLVSYVKDFTLTFIAGNSKDHEESEERSHLVLVDPKLNKAQRTNILGCSWEDLGALLSLSPEMKLRTLRLLASDIHPGGDRFNEEPLPQYKFIPIRFERLLLLHGFTCPDLKKLVLGSEILDQLEIEPSTVRSIIYLHRSIEALELRTSDIRAYRHFRRNIYNGLVKTLEGLSISHPNLTSLELHYPSSTGDWHFNDSNYSGVYSLANCATKHDALSSALRALSKGLVNFHYRGRISSKLFLSSSTSAKAVGWQRLKRYHVEFDRVDCFGKTLLSPMGSYYECRELICDTCLGAEPQFVYDAANESLHAVANAANQTSEDDEYGFDLLLCEGCLQDSMLMGRMDIEEARVDVLFLAASEAMIQMPEIEHFEFRSACSNVVFAFDKSKNTASIQRYWKPCAKAEGIWEGRFQRFERIVLRDAERDEDDDLESIKAYDVEDWLPRPCDDHKQGDGGNEEENGDEEKEEEEDGAQNETGEAGEHL